MAELAWAVRVVEENYDAILSECAGGFDRSLLLEWVEEHGTGYFLRDADSPLDCLLMDEENFLLLYHFENGNESAMFRTVVKN
jgi:hypothetical protein